MFSTILFLQMSYYNCVALDAGAHINMQLNTSVAIIIAIDNVFVTNLKTT